MSFGETVILSSRQVALVDDPDDSGIRNFAVHDPTEGTVEHTGTTRPCEYAQDLAFDFPGEDERPYM